MEKPIKIFLACILFVCLLKMPYGFYQLVRVAALIGVAILAYIESQAGKMEMVRLYLGLALLFQPLL
ncbi:DUF6804 family protein [Aureispira sp. CCB-E]|uniref:DUF6804 family protein n=1 Tax=Aureispira sp. CCB-E TaxID=3051121 RepID=UPI002868A14F|nr:DUF6804 family protein [Aureispira sp. CCB-E]WMX16518.1 hypothetical protein QP953_09080 [Aureispira sp. CCB-E]